MREILFRGKADTNRGDGKWHYGVPILYKPISKSYIPQWQIYTKDKERIPVFSDTIGQYTGLTDRNGTKIFEGDIVTGLAYSTDRIGVICWIDEAASFGIKYKTGSGGLRECPTAWQKSSILTALTRFPKPKEGEYDRCDDFQAKIIGNIYDNPDYATWRKFYE